MPTWGLTTEQRSLKPWGIDPRLLKPSKVTTDPIHGDVHTTVLEQAIIDTEPFQRLRRVRQLGNSHLVYPGATQSRFSHALGALREVQNFLDAVTSQREGLHAAPDLIDQWLAEDEDEAQRHIARVIVLARLGALLHDLCHLPYGHSIEDDLRLLPAHDEGEDRFRRFWKEIRRNVRQRVGQHYDKDAQDSLDELLNQKGTLLEELRPLIISKGKKAKSQHKMKYPFVADLVGNTICADLLDYLRRDHLYTGLPVSLGTRFISAFFITPDHSGLYSRRMAINIMRDGHERTDVISELLKALRFRYELSERVLVHHTKLAADAMVGKMLELYADAVWLENAEPSIGKLEASEELLANANLGPLKEAVRKADAKESRGAERKTAQALLEVLTEHGDEGLLEFIEGPAATSARSIPVRERAEDLYTAAADLARQLLTRRLYKPRGRAGTKSAPAKALFKRFGDPDARRRLQDEAQRFAGMESSSQLLIWLPDPKMRLKQAEVLVDDGHHVNRFVDYERVRSGRGSDIYDAHERLWAVWVFFDPSVKESAHEEALVYLARELGVCWEGMLPKFGPHAHDWIERLALSRYIRVEPRHPDIDELLAMEPMAARGLDSDATFADYEALVPTLEQARKLRRQHGG